MGSKVIDLTGQKFGRLSPQYSRCVVRDNRQPYTVWFCLCDCGFSLEVRAKDLRDGKTRSCGCFRREVLTSHGLNVLGMRNIFKAIDARCNDKNAKGYNRYGGRGIKLCMTAEQFAGWCVLNPRPTEKHQIDRIDNNGNYSLDNIRWSSIVQQQRNRGNNRIITAWGVSKVLAEWVDLAGLRYATIHHRLCAGWSPEQAFATKKGCKPAQSPCCILEKDLCPT